MQCAVVFCEKTKTKTTHFWYALACTRTRSVLECLRVGVDDTCLGDLSRKIRNVPVKTARTASGVCLFPSTSSTHADNLIV